MNNRLAIIKMISFLLSGFLLAGLTGCPNNTEKPQQTTQQIQSQIEKSTVSPLGYNLSSPDRTIKLPIALREISGITLTDSKTLACIQDENGLIFLVDIEKGEMKSYFSFHSNGDYEGIAYTGTDIYVLKSNGNIYQVSLNGSSGTTTKILKADIDEADFEGLCFDRKNNRLLAVPKNNPLKDSQGKDRHPAYGLDLKTGSVTRTPVIYFDRNAIKELTKENDIDNASFKPSAIGIHPVTGELYVLSADSRMLFIFSPDGTIRHAEKLDRDIFNMPEGIAFLPGGDMFISNEGKESTPNVLRFNYTRK
jgi:uncharacterized protein YjiK